MKRKKLCIPFLQSVNFLIATIFYYSFVTGPLKHRAVSLIMLATSSSSFPISGVLKKEKSGTLKIEEHT